MLTRTQEFIRGDQFFSEIYEIWDEEANAAKDVTGYTFTSHVKASPLDTDPVFSFTVMKVDAANGLVRLRVDPSDTQDVDIVNWRNGPTVFVYDVEMVADADATDKQTPLGGPVLLHSDVTY